MIKIDWTKVATYIVVGVLFATLVTFNIKQCNDSNDLRGQVVEMKELQDGIMRSQATYASKEDVEKMAKDIDLNLDAIKDDLEDFGAEIKGISVVLARSLGQNTTNIPSTGTTPNPGTNPYVCPDNKPCKDPYGYLTNAQILALAEQFSAGVSVPIGKVTFESWKEKPWSIFQYARDYYLTTVLGQDVEGKHYTYHKFEIGADGKRYVIPITSAQFIEELPEPSFHWWNPRVGVGMYGGIGFFTSPLPGGDIVTGVAVPNFSFSPFSYGQTKVKPDFVFPRVGVGYDFVQNTANFSLAPFMWNIGSEVSFIQNSHIGPVIGVDTSGVVSAGAGFSTDF